MTEDEGAGSQELVPGRQRGGRQDHSGSRRLQASSTGSIYPGVTGLHLQDTNARVKF